MASIRTTLRRSLRLSVACTALMAGVLALSSPALAQDDRRGAALEKQVRELRAIVFQGRDTGQPVVVKPEGPDPQVVALQGKVEQLEEQLRDLTGRLEVMSHDSDEARRGAEQSRAEAATARQALSDRVAKLEAQLGPPPPPPAPSAASDAPPPRPSSRGDNATARAQATDTGQLGGADAAPAAPPRAAGFDESARLLAAGDYPGAQAGFEAYIAKNRTGPRTAEARYDLGQTLYAQANFAEAASAYASALKGWPKTRWAPEATLKLTQALVQLDRNPTACQALAEFDRRYAASAGAGPKARANAARARAQCAAG